MDVVLSCELCVNMLHSNSKRIQRGRCVCGGGVGIMNHVNDSSVVCI